MGSPPDPSSKGRTRILSEASVQSVVDRLRADKRVRRTLHPWGRLHIDRALPFLVVYRRPPERADPGTSQLVSGEAAYLKVSGAREYRKDLGRVLRALITTLGQHFGGFLLLELWTGTEDAVEDIDEGPRSPAFRVVTAPRDAPETTLKRLEESLRAIRVQRGVISEVTRVSRGTPAPPEMPPLLSARQRTELGCHLVGLEVRPVYRGNNETYPLLLRKLHHQLTHALKRAFFEFVRSSTTHPASHFLALGRRAMVKAVWQVDERLAKLARTFDFILQVTPTDTARAWGRFRRARYARPPRFTYRPLPIEPDLIKRRLFNLHIEHIEDPLLESLFREKREELERQVTMLGDLGTPRFLWGSLQLYGGVEPELLTLANELLDTLPPHPRESRAGRALDAAAFAQRARREIAAYRKEAPKMRSRVEVRDDVVGLLVSRGNLLVGKQSQIPAARVEALLAHEVGTHIVTYVNGRAQPFQQLAIGMAGYEELQEGLAVFAEYLVGGLSLPRVRLLAARVVAAHALVDGASFVDAFRLLVHDHGFARQEAFAIVTRIYRAGGLTKDAVYLGGLRKLLKFLEEGGTLDRLFVGKIATEHIPLVRELLWRKVLSPPRLTPHYLSNPEVRERLQRARRGLTVTDMVRA